MKILMLHNHYLERGGEDESTEAEVALLRQHGHEVDFFELDNRVIASRPLLRTGVETVWSAWAYRAIRERIQRGKPDLVHIQNFFPLFSPAVHHAAKAEGTPVVQALRNYRLLCLNGTFFRDQHNCEDCLGKFLPWPGVVHRCYRQSLPSSAAVAAMLIVHRALKTWDRKVDVLMVLTEFMRQKLIQGGLSDERIIVKPNFVLSDPGPGNHDGGFALFVGRLSPEKGTASLVRAWEAMQDIPLKIVGDGPLRPQMREFEARNSNVEVLGWIDPSAVLTLMKNARALVFPSQWYEGFPRVVVEAFACGLPVIAANIGSTAEIVPDRIAGLHFQGDDDGDLVSKVKWAWEHPREAAEMGRNARKEYELKYTPARNYQLLMEIYQTAIEHSSGQGHGHPPS